MTDRPSGNVTRKPLLPLKLTSTASFAPGSGMSSGIGARDPRAPIGQSVEERDLASVVERLFVRGFPFRHAPTACTAAERRTRRRMPTRVVSKPCKPGGFECAVPVALGNAGAET